MRRESSSLTVSLALPLLLLVACSRGDDSPEARIRSLIHSGEVAAQEKDLASLKGMISASYTDGAGRDRRALLGLLRYHFLRHDRIYLMTRVHEISLDEAELAHASLFVAMAGEPITAVEELSRLHADLHRFDLSLNQEEGRQWRVTRADWRRATLDDFF